MISTKREIEGDEERCRICEETNNLTDTWTEEFNHLLEQLQTVTDSEENFRIWLRFICMSCKNELNNLWNFKIRCKNAYQKFLDEATRVSGSSRSCSNENMRDFEESHEEVKEMIDKIKTEKETIQYEDVETIRLPERRLSAEAEDFGSQKEAWMVNVRVKCEEKDETQLKDLQKFQPKEEKVVSRKKTKPKGNSLKRNLKKEYEYSCQICDYKSYRTVDLGKHMRKHVNNFSCNVCGKHFAYQANLNRHQLMHVLKNEKHVKRVDTVDTAIICRTCKRDFPTKEDRKVHRELYCQKSKNCSSCAKTFRNPAELIMHERTAHDGERPYKCDMCSKSYVRRSILKRHFMTKHLQHQRFKCPHCAKDFAWKSDLSVHMRFHSGETPYMSAQRARKDFIYSCSTDDTKLNVQDRK